MLCLLDFRSKSLVESNVLPSFYCCVIFVYFPVNIFTVKLLIVISFTSYCKNNILKARNVSNIRVLYNLYDHVRVCILV